MSRIPLSCFDFSAKVEGDDAQVKDDAVKDSSLVSGFSAKVESDAVEDASIALGVVDPKPVRQARGSRPCSSPCIPGEIRKALVDTMEELKGLSFPALERTVGRVGHQRRPAHATCPNVSIGQKRQDEDVVDKSLFMIA